MDDFTTLASGSCASADRLLLAVAAEFRPVVWDEALERLDDLGRRVFGIAGFPAGAAARELGRAMACEAGLTEGGDGIRGLLLDQVLIERRGHPALLAFVYAEAARRAGVPAAVYSGPTRWYAGIARDGEIAVVEPAAAPAAAAPEGAELRRHCGHEIAWCVLCGLARRLRARGAHEAAQRACALRTLLPIEPRRPDAL